MPKRSTKEYVKVLLRRAEYLAKRMEERKTQPENFNFDRRERTAILHGVAALKTQCEACTPASQNFVQILLSAPPVPTSDVGGLGDERQEAVSETKNQSTNKG